MNLIISVNIDSINKISYNDNNTTVYFDNQK